MKRPSSIREIAAHSGFSKSTVALALKGHSSIPKVTAEKIQKAARDLDYRPNPMVSSLMASLRARKRSSSGPVIAYLTASRTRTGWKENRSFEKYYLGARARARELGYKLEHFWLREPGMSDERYDQIFTSRGISGLVLGPAPTNTPIRLDWPRYAMAKVGFSLTEIEGHTVANHQTRTILHLLRKLNELGMWRIGLVTTNDDDDRVENSWSAGNFVHHRQVPKKFHVPAFQGALNRRTFLTWRRRHRPDAVVTTRSQLLSWMREDGVDVPEDVGLAYLDAHPGQQISGMDQRSESIGAAAVDLVVEQLNNNERGIPAHPKTVLTNVVWFSGQTT